MQANVVGADATDLEGPNTTGRAAWPFVLAVAVGSWLVHALAGAALSGASPPDPFQLKNPADVPFGRLNMWARWDGVHYLDIAQHGYSPAGAGPGGSPAFFPLYPLLVRLAGTLFGGPLDAASLGVVAVIVSTACLPVGLWFVHELARDLASERAAQVAVLLVAFFPVSFFLTAAYTEGLFLVLTAGALWAVRVRRDLALACALTALAAATRNLGIVLCLPVAVEWWHRRDLEPRRWSWHPGWFGLAPAGLVAYVFGLWVTLGDPLAFLHAQAGWGRSYSVVANAGHAVVEAGRSAGSVFDPANYEPVSVSRFIIGMSGGEGLLNLLCFGAAAVVLVAARKLLPWHLAVYSGVLFLVPAAFPTGTDPLMSSPRFVLMAFPLFIAGGVWLAGRGARAAAVTVAVGAAWSVPLIALFVNWHFVA